MKKISEVQEHSTQTNVEVRREKTTDSFIRQKKEIKGCECKFCIHRRPSNRNVAKEIKIPPAGGYGKSSPTQDIGNGTKFHNRRPPGGSKMYQSLRLQRFMVSVSRRCTFYSAKLQSRCTRENKIARANNATKAVPSCIPNGRCGNGFYRRATHLCHY